MTPRIGTSEPTMSDFYCGAGGSSTGAGVAVGAGIGACRARSNSFADRVAFLTAMS